jgi:hypothetical protein
MEPGVRRDVPAEGRHEGRVRLKDVLRLDVPRVHGAITGQGVEASPAAKFLLRLLEEHRPRYKTRVLYCPPLPLLWNFGPGDGSPASTIHQAYSRAVWRERGLVGRAGLLCVFLLWPFIVSGMATWLTAVNGGAVRRRTGKGLLRQLGEQFGLAARHGILPPWYYIYDLYEDSNRARAGEYLRRDETKGGLYRLLKEPSAKRRLFDKRRFAKRCHEEGVATPESLALHKGEIRSLDGEAPVLPRADLFVKPTRGQGGRSTEVWKFDGEGWSIDGKPRLTEAELLEHFRAIARKEGFLVQRRLVNHADLVDLSLGVLATVRILTCRDEAGGFEATQAVYRMPKTPLAKVDNIHAGGIAAKIDMATGELGLASDMGLRPDTDWWSSHPHTGVQIQGRKLPYWQETVDLACHAHAAFPKWTVVGWDIAILDGGPVVIEGNSGPDVDLVQRPCRAPLGSSRFGELMAHHLARLESAAAADR